MTCIFGHRPILYSEEFMQNGTFYYYTCLDCDKKAIKVIGWGGMKNPKWKKELEQQRDELREEIQEKWGDGYVVSVFIR